MKIHLQKFQSFITNMCLKNVEALLFLKYIVQYIHLISIISLQTNWIFFYQLENAVVISPVATIYLMIYLLIIVD